MINKQQNILRALLKKYKFKSVSNMVRQALGINYENFLQKTEPLYVIPRIASCYADENDKKTLMGVVYKEWLKDVVEKAWVAPLNAYIEEHGERTVLSAIYYLIDNHLWEVYEGRLALDAQEDNYYDKLEDMPTAISFVLEQQKAEEKKAKEEEAAKAAATVENASVPSDFIAGSKSGYTLTSEEAVTLIGTTTETCAQLKQNIERLFDFVHTATDTDALRKEIASLQQQLEDLKAQHQQEVDTLVQQAADKELETYKKILEEEANREQLPKKKVIPYSVLDAVPLLGKGVMTGLVPVLAKYNIVVDYNK